MDSFTFELPALPEPEPSIELPSGIKGLRYFIRANELQSVVKEKIGKSVSKYSKSELLMAIA